MVSCGKSGGGGLLHPRTIKLWSKSMNYLRFFGSPRRTILIGVALILLNVLIASILFALDLSPDTLGWLRSLISWVAFIAIGVGIVRLGSAKGWWGDISKIGGVDKLGDTNGLKGMNSSQLFGSAKGRLVTGVVLILLGLLVRSTSFLEFLRGTGFLLDMVIEIDQSLWFLYKPLHSSLGSLLHDLSPTLGVISWLGILAGIALVVIAVRRMRGQKETQKESG